MKLLCGWLGVALFAAIATAAEKPLTNDDVIALVKAGVGDEVVIAKIQHSTQQAFDLSTDAIIRLKKAGVPQKVIATMLGGGPAAPGQPAPVVQTAATPFGTGMVINGLDSIDMITADGTVRIDRRVGRLSTTNVIVGMLMWCNVPEPRAEIRTGDTAPVFRFHSQHRPSETYKLVRAESNEKDRSVKLESKSFYAMRDSVGFAVDEDWQIAVSEEQTQPGLWLIKPKQPLKPGEYGVIAGLEYFYGFGVDGDTLLEGESALSKLKSKLKRGKS